VKGGPPVIYTRRRKAHGPLVDMGAGPRESAGRVLEPCAGVAQDSHPAMRGAHCGGLEGGPRLAQFQAAEGGFTLARAERLYGDCDGNIAYLWPGHVRRGKGEGSAADGRLDR